MTNTSRPQIRRASSRLRIPAQVWDFRHGEKFVRNTTMVIVAEEWLNARTGRYGRRYAAGEEGGLGLHMGRTPREAITNAVSVAPGPRAPWLADAVRQAKSLTYTA